MKTIINYEVFSNYLKGDKFKKFRILKYIVESRDVNTLKFFLDKKDKLEFIAQYGGNTLLHHACYLGYKEIAELLLKNNVVDINELDGMSRTPLHLAVKFGQIEITDYLISKGADTTIRDIARELPLKSAIDRKDAEIIELLIKK